MALESCAIFYSIIFFKSKASHMKKVELRYS